MDPHIPMCINSTGQVVRTKAAKVEVDVVLINSRGKEVGFFSVIYVCDGCFYTLIDSCLMKKIGACLHL